MSKVSMLSSPLLLGFEEMERLIDRVGKNGQRLQDWPNVAPSKALYTALRESGGKALLHASDIELSAKLDDYGFKPKGLGDCAGKRAPDLHLLQAQLEKRYEALKGKWRYKEWGEVKDVQLKLAT